MPYRRPAADPRLGLTVLERQRRRCEQGEHDVPIVAAGRVVYTPGGRGREVGEQYCRCCGETLAAGPVRRPRTATDGRGHGSEEEEPSNASGT
jgi:hypothetical protein